MCTPIKKQVTWIIDKSFMEKIYKSLYKDSDEIAGKIFFEDYLCNKEVCNKKIKDYTISKGNGASVLTPFGIINFHTHPKSAYEGENAKYGWPSGEDMRQSLEFADKGCLVHLVFTLEGVYVINVLKLNINKKDKQILETVLKMTHIFRSSDQKEQYKNFIKFMGKTDSRTTLDMWLKLVNNLTLKKLYKMYNFLNNKKLTIPNDKSKIFNVSLVKNSPEIKFKANFIKTNCHYKSFYGHSYQRNKSLKNHKNL